MKLVDVTNSYAKLVSKQLENTDAYFVKIYSLGKTLVVYSKATSHIEILLVNKTRNIKNLEVDAVLKQILDTSSDDPALDIISTQGIVEIELLL